jgi:hypothetical protein
MDPINTALNHFTSMGLSQPEATALVNQGLTAYNQMQPQQMSYGGRAGYADGGLGSMMQAPQGMQQAAGGQMDPQQAIQIIIQLLVDNGVPLEQAKKLAIQMLQIFMQGGEPALNQFADQLEQEEQQAMAAGGIAGLHPRQRYLFGGIGRAISGVVKGVAGVVKGVAKAVKSVVKSDIGKIALLAGGAYLMMNPGALSGLFGTAAAETTAANLATQGLANTTLAAAPSAAGGLGIVGADIALPTSFAAASGIPASTVGSTIAADTFGSSTAADIFANQAASTAANTAGQTLLQQGVNKVPSISDKFISAIQNPGKTIMDLGQGAYDYVKENKIRTAFDVANLAGLYSNYAGAPTPLSLGAGQRKGQVEPYLRASAQRLHPEWTSQQVDEYVSSNLSEYAANGGIMGYANGGVSEYEDSPEEQMEAFDRSREQSPEQQPVINQMASPDAYIKLVEHYMSLGYDYEQASKLAYDHFKTGEDQSPSTPGDFRDYKKVAMGGMIPPSRKAGGIMELDARDSGGFIPYGKKERHDDVPAVLAKNEFVFTSKAVRNAGGGDIKKGAKKMYALMRQLEGKRA